MKRLIPFLLVSPVYADNYVSIGKHYRPGGMDLALGRVHDNGLGYEISYADFGRQPDTETRNRALNLNLVGKYELQNVRLYAKAGLTSTVFSSPYNDFDWDKGFKGYNYSAGVEYKLDKVFLSANIANYHYVQCSQDGRHHYLYSSLGIGYNF